MNAKKEEMLRRLECIESANSEMRWAEAEWDQYKDDAYEPFRGWPGDGEISVIYDRDGKVSHRVVR